MTNSGLSISTPWLIIAATLLGELAVYSVVLLLGQKQKGVFFVFVTVAGGASASLTVKYPHLAWPIFAGCVAFSVLLWFLLHRLGKNLNSTNMTWTQYLKGQGALLFLSLLVGGIVAWISVTYGPYPGRVSRGQLVKWEDLDPSQHPVYREVDVENYSDIMVLTRTDEPAHGSAALTIYLDHGNAGKLEYGHLDSGTESWSRWDQAVAGKKLNLVAGPPTQTGAVPATKMEILVYLKPKQ